MSIGSWHGVIRHLCVSIPMEAGHITLGIHADGAPTLMVHGDGMGTNWQGHYSVLAPGQQHETGDCSHMI